MTDDVIERALELADRCAGGLNSDQWRLVRDAGALLARAGRARTQREQWLVDASARVSRWLGPAPEVTDGKVD